MIAILDVKALPPHLKPFVRDSEVRKVKRAVFCLSATDFASVSRSTITYDTSTSEGQGWARACHLCLMLEKPCLVATLAQKKKKGKGNHKGGDADVDFTCGPCTESHRGCSLFVLNRKGTTLEFNIFLLSFLSGVCPQDSLYTTRLSYAQLGSHFEAIHQGKKVTQSAQDKADKAQLAAAPLGLASMVSSSSADGYLPTPSRLIQGPPFARYERPTIVPPYVPPSIPVATLPADQRTW